MEIEIYQIKKDCGDFVLDTHKGTEFEDCTGYYIKNGNYKLIDLKTGMFLISATSLESLKELWETKYKAMLKEAREFTMYPHYLKRFNETFNIYIKKEQTPQIQAKNKEIKEIKEVISKPKKKKLF